MEHSPGKVCNKVPCCEHPHNSDHLSLTHRAQEQGPLLASGLPHQGPRLHIRPRATSPCPIETAAEPRSISYSSAQPWPQLSQSRLQPVFWPSFNRSSQLPTAWLKWWDKTCPAVLLYKCLEIRIYMFLVQLLGKENNSKLANFSSILVLLLFRFSHGKWASHCQPLVFIPKLYYRRINEQLYREKKKVFRVLGKVRNFKKLQRCRKKSQQHWKTNSFYLITWSPCLVLSREVTCTW